ncbi:autotransporter outer membrane beta-barrel domain-containing protein [Bartonella sp. CB74]|uniref:autotransporter outer membrane beta-barrel domain-containing protein n=1 Tax=Bartonella sp. CB74 TaxID=3113620 RepID=UPI002F964B05
MINVLKNHTHLCAITTSVFFFLQGVNAGIGQVSEAEGNFRLCSSISKNPAPQGGGEQVARICKEYKSQDKKFTHTIDGYKFQINGAGGATSALRAGIGNKAGANGQGMPIKGKDGVFVKMYDIGRPQNGDKAHIVANGVTIIGEGFSADVSGGGFLANGLAQDASSAVLVGGNTHIILGKEGETKSVINGFPIGLAATSGGKIEMNEGTISALSISAGTDGTSTITLKNTAVDMGSNAGAAGFVSMGGTIDVTGGSVSANGTAGVGAKTSAAGASITLKSTQIQMRNSTASIGLLNGGGTISMTSGSIIAGGVGAKTSAQGGNITLNSVDIQKGENAGDIGLEGMGGTITMTNGSIAAKKTGAKTSAGSIILAGAQIQMGDSVDAIGVMNEGGTINVTSGSIIAGGVGAKISNQSATITLTNVEIQKGKNAGNVGVESEGGTINVSGGSIIAKTVGAKTSASGVIALSDNVQISMGEYQDSIGLENGGGAITMTGGLVSAGKVGAKTSAQGAKITLTNAQVQMGNSASNIGLESGGGTIEMTGGSVSAKTVGAKTSANGVITLSNNVQIQMGQHVDSIGLESAGGTITMTGGSVSAGKVGAKTSANGAITLSGSVQIQKGQNADSIGLESAGGAITMTGGSVSAGKVGAKTSAAGATITLNNVEIQKEGSAGGIGLESEVGTITMTGGSIAAKKTGAKALAAGAVINLNNTQIQMGKHGDSTGLLGDEGGVISVRGGSISAGDIAVHSLSAGTQITLEGVQIQKGSSAGKYGLRNEGGTITMTGGGISVKNVGVSLSGADANAKVTLKNTPIEMGEHINSVGLAGLGNGTIEVKGGKIAAGKVGAKTSNAGATITLSDNVQITMGQHADSTGLENGGGTITMEEGKISSSKVGAKTSAAGATITLNGTRIETNKQDSIGLESTSGTITMAKGLIAAQKAGAKTSGAGAAIALNDGVQITMGQYADSIGLESAGGAITMTGGEISAGKIGAKTSAEGATIALTDIQVQVVQNADAIGLESAGGAITMNGGSISAKKVGAQSSAANATITLNGTQIQMGQHADSIGLESKVGTIKMKSGEVVAGKVAVKSLSSDSVVTLTDTAIKMVKAGDTAGLISEGGGKIDVVNGSISANKVGIKAKDKGSAVTLTDTKNNMKVDVTAVGLISENGGAITITGGSVSANEIGAQSSGQESKIILGGTQVTMGQNAGAIGLKSEDGGAITVIGGEVSANKAGAQSLGQESKITLSATRVTMGQNADAIGLISDNGGAIKMTGGSVSANKTGAQSSGQGSKITLSGIQITMGQNADAIGLISDSGGVIDVKYGSISANGIGAQSSGQGSRISLGDVTVGESANAVAIGLKSEGGAITMTGGSISAQKVGAQLSGQGSEITLTDTRIAMGDSADSIGLKNEGGAITMTGGSISAQKVGAQLSGQGSEITLTGTQITMGDSVDSIGLKSEGGRLTITDGLVSAGEVGAQSSNGAEIILTGTTVSAGKVGDTIGLKSAGGKITMTGGSISANDRGVEAQGQGSEVILTETKIGTVTKTEIDTVTKTLRKKKNDADTITVKAVDKDRNIINEDVARIETEVIDRQRKIIDVEENFPLIGIYSTSGTIKVTDGWIFAKGTGVQSITQSNVTLNNTVVDMGDNVGATGIISDGSTLAMTGGLILANDKGISAQRSQLTLDDVVIEMGDNAGAIGINSLNSTVRVKDGLILANNIGVAVKQGSTVTLTRTDVDMGDNAGAIGIIVETSRVLELDGNPSALTMEGGSVVANTIGIKALGKNAAVTLKGTVIEGGDSVDAVGLLGETGSIIKVDRGEISANGVGVRAQDSTVILGGTRIKMRDNITAKGLVSESSTITMEDGVIVAKGIGIDSSKKSTITLNDTEIMMGSNEDSIGLISEESTIKMNGGTIFADKVGIESSKKSKISLNDVKIDTRKNEESIGLISMQSTVEMDGGSISSGKVGIQLSQLSNLTLSETKIQMGRNRDSIGLISDNSVVTMNDGFVSARGVGIKADQKSNVTLNDTDIKMIDGKDAIGLVSVNGSTITMTKGKISTQGVGVQSDQGSTVILSGTDIKMGKDNKDAIALKSEGGTINMTGGSVTVDGVVVQSEGSKGNVTLDRVRIANAGYSNDVQSDMRSAFLLKDGGSVTFVNGSVNVKDFTGLRVVGNAGVVNNGLDPINVEGPKQANIEKSDIIVNGQGSYGMYFGEFQADRLRARRAVEPQAYAQKLGSVLLKKTTFRTPNGTAVYADNFAGHVFLEGAMLSGEFLLKSKNGSDVLVWSDGSSIVGGADTDRNSRARIYLSNYSSWLLTQTEQEVSCLNNMNACVSSVNIENGSIQFSGETGQGYKYQTLYIGNEGASGIVYDAGQRAVLYLKAQKDLSGVGDEQVVDRVFIDGGVSGKTTVSVLGVNASKGNGIQNTQSASSVSVIQVSGAAQQDSFTLGSEYITLGNSPYSYVLRAYAPANGNVAVARFDGKTDASGGVWDFRLEKEAINNEIVIAPSTSVVLKPSAPVAPLADAPEASETARSTTSQTAAAGDASSTKLNVSSHKTPYDDTSGLASSGLAWSDPATGGDLIVVTLPSSTSSGSEIAYNVEYDIAPSADGSGADVSVISEVTQPATSETAGDTPSTEPHVDPSGTTAPALSDTVTVDVARSDATTADIAAQADTTIAERVSPSAPSVDGDKKDVDGDKEAGDSKVIKLVSKPKYLQTGDVIRYSDGSKVTMNIISSDVIINNPTPAPSEPVIYPVYFLSVPSLASAHIDDADVKPDNAACDANANETISKGNSIWCHDGQSYTISDKVIQMSDSNQHVVRVRRAQTSADADNREEVGNNKTTVTMDKVNIVGAGLTSDRRDRIILKKLVSAVLAEQDGEAIIKESKIMSVPIGVEAQSGGSIKMTDGVIDALYVGVLADSASSIHLEDGVEINVRGPLAIAGLSSSNGSTVSMNEGLIDFTNGVAVRSASGGRTTLKQVSITGKRAGVDPNSSSLVDGAAILLNNGGSVDFGSGTVLTDSHGLWVVNSGADRAQNVATIENSVIEVSGDQSYGIYLDGSLQKNVDQSVNKIAEEKGQEALVLSVENGSVQKDVNEPSTASKEASQVVLVSDVQGDSATKSVRTKRGLVLPQGNLADEITTISLKETFFETQGSTAVYGDNFKGRISLEKKTTLSGDLLLRSENNSDLSISVDNSVLIGGSRVDSNSHAKIDLSNGSEWRLTKSKKASDTVSSISSISLKDSVIRFMSSASEGEPSYQTLRIGNGSGTVYSAEGGASIHLNARLNPEDLGSDQVTDRLLIHGDVSGKTIVHVHAVSGSAEQNKESARTAHGVSIIQVYGTAEADSFKLNGDYVALENSPYQYTLRSYSSAAHSQTMYFDEQLAKDGKGFWDFRLENQFVDVADSAHTLPTSTVDNMFETALHPERNVRFKVVPQVPTYLLAPNSLFHAGLMDISNQNKQLEAMRTASSGMLEAHENPALFLRGYSGSYRYASDLSKLEYGYGGDLSYNAVEAGMLLQAIENAYSTVSFGVMGTYGKLSLQPLEVERSQESAFDKWSVTAYGSMQHDAGFYVDGLLSYGLFKGDVLTLARGKTATLKGNPLSVSLTGGQAFVTGYEGFVLDPQVQVVYQNLQFNDARDVDNFDINMGKLDQWVVRVGGRLTKNPTGFEIGDASAVFFYGKLHLAHSFEKKQSVHFKDAFQLGAFGSSVEAGLGINARLSPNLALHGDLMYQHKLTKAGFSGATFSGGMRYQF